MSKLDWDKARRDNNRAARRAADFKPLKLHADKPPTDRQIALLRELASETDQTFAWPRTSRQASARIKDLLARRKKPRT